MAFPRSKFKAPSCSPGAVAICRAAKMSGRPGAILLRRVFLGFVFVARQPQHPAQLGRQGVAVGSASLVRPTNPASSSFSMSGRSRRLSKPKWERNAGVVT